MRNYIEACEDCPYFFRNVISREQRENKSVFVMCEHLKTLYGRFKDLGFDVEYGCPLRKE